MSNSAEWTEDDINQLVAPLNNHFYDQFQATMHKRGYVLKTAEELDKAAQLAAKLLIKVSSNPASRSALDALHDKIASANGIDAAREQEHVAMQQKIAEAAMDPLMMYTVDTLDRLQPANA